MDKRFTSIIEELANYVPIHNRDLFIEGRAQQVIASAVNLIHLIHESYSGDLAEDLTKRLLSSIKNEDEEKFRRKIRQVRDTKRKAKSNGQA